MKRVIPLLIILLSTTSCIYQSMVRFTDEDLLWLTSYHKHDMVFFRTPDNILDTMTIPYRKISNETFPIHCHINKSDPFHYHAYGFYDFKIFGINKDRAILNGFLQCTKISKDTLTITININDYWCYEKAIKELNDFSFDGYTFDDCLILDMSDEDFLDNKTPPEFRYPQSVTNIVWSRSKGLLQYTVDSTQVFSRQWN